MDFDIMWLREKQGVFPGLQTWVGSHPVWQLENVLGNCALKLETGCTFLSFSGVLVMMII